MTKKTNENEPEKDWFEIDPYNLPEDPEVAYSKGEHIDLWDEVKGRGAGSGEPISAMRRAKYGISSQDYYIILKSQNYKCRICNRDFFKIKTNIDHCHKTGKVRGILCQKCNTGLGFFSDNVEVLCSAIEYLLSSDAFALVKGTGQLSSISDQIDPGEGDEYD